MKRAGRLHGPELDALAAPPGPCGTSPEAIELRAPMPGVFTPAVAAGDLVAPGATLGELAVLGRATAVIAPRTAASGIAIRVVTAASQAVGYGDPLVTIDPSLQHGAAIAGPSTAAGTAATTAALGLVFRAPTSGRFYGRSAPDKPAFVTAGATLATGATICLLEVMKTFHRVTYGGPGLPDTARVTRVLVGDGDDVNAGDPLLALE
ncbi:MAG TPA: biotin/lipoyl-containing protein [Kofleriaceae bacterium]|jgi:acetyl-CoA carboxylase biotin carboxyl carrier protein|nr:biotin/lipoyl-containing protein [Kofleriaceae bacterium]